MVIGELGKPHGYSSRYSRLSATESNGAYRLGVDLLAVWLVFS